MGSRRLSRLSLTGVALTAALLATARAGEPTARELIALAPVLDSSDGRCHSLEIGGWYGSDETLAPKLRFRATYRAPNQFSLLIANAEDGTPLAFGAGRKMFLYDPVAPTVYYSEDACSSLEMACTETELKFRYDVLLKRDGKPDCIRVDFRAVMSNHGGAGEGRGFEDRVVKRNSSKYRLLRCFEDKPYLALEVDLTKDSPYTAASFIYDGRTYLCLDRIILNGAPRDEPFTFPSRRRLSRGLPFKDVTGDKEWAASPNSAAVIARALIVRSVLDTAGPPELIHIPGLTGVDWNRVKENDRKFGKVLRDLVPPSVRADQVGGGSSRTDSSAASGAKPEP
jgi:hypothetical protein